MFIGIRSAVYGSSVLLLEDGTVYKIGAKFGYTSWHPTGRVAAYSVNMVQQFFHLARTEVRDVIDLDSLIAYYLADSKTIKTSPQISKRTVSKPIPSGHRTVVTCTFAAHRYRGRTVTLFLITSMRSSMTWFE